MITIPDFHTAMERGAAMRRVRIWGKVLQAAYILFVLGVALWAWYVVMTV